MEVSKNLYYTLIFLAIITMTYYAYKRMMAISIKENAATEGFTQDSPFILKRNEKTYDRFYSKLYNHIFDSPERNKYQVDAIVDSTVPTTENSVFLDIGCGTGEIIRDLKKRGYTAYGIDRSRAMLKVAGENCKKCRGKDDDGEKIIKEGDIMDPMVFDANIFTHILCLNGTIYEIPDKDAFFKNVHKWMMRSGYFILHLVTKSKFTEASPTELEFRGIEYKSSYSLMGAAGDSKNPDSVLMKEVFKDKQTGNVRENERTLYVEDLLKIVNKVKLAGFNVHAIIDMKPVKTDKYQYIYIFEKI